ncbi:MAG: hypothetical protein ACI9WU_002995 [Myxococcota bacterium]|jgi:hypothetical protein
MKPASRYLLATSLALSTLMCAGSEGTQGETGGAAVITYALIWKDSRPVQALDCGAWQVLTDLGYTVRVDVGYVVTYSIQLTECPEEIAWWSPRSRLAWAGHSEIEDSPTLLQAGWVESLTNPEPIEPGTVWPRNGEASPGPWCGAHYLLARADDDTLALPDDVEMYGSTLYLAGSWTAPGQTEPTPFAIRSLLAAGALRDLEDLSSQVAETGSVRIEAVRDRAALFDGITLQDHTDEELGWRVLDALVGDNLQLRVSPEEDHHDPL